MADCPLEQYAMPSVCEAPYGRRLPSWDVGTTVVRRGIVTIFVWIESVKKMNTWGIKFLTGTLFRFTRHRNRAAPADRRGSDSPGGELPPAGTARADPGNPL